MQLDVAVILLESTKSHLLSYKTDGFAAAQVSAKAVCEEMYVEAVLKEKRPQSTQTHFAYEASDEPVRDALKMLETIFNAFVDFAIFGRFETCGEVKSKSSLRQKGPFL